MSAREDLDHAASIVTGGPSNAEVSHYERTVLASQLRAHPKLTGLVHYARGWLPGGIDFTGCGLRLHDGCTVAGRLGSADETTCVECLAALARVGGVA